MAHPNVALFDVRMGKQIPRFARNDKGRLWIYRPAPSVPRIPFWSAITL